MGPKVVRIFDTTLRDGEQTPGVHMTASQKVQIAQALEAFGVNTIEAGFPASSPGDAAAVAAVAAAVRTAEVAALARCRKEDIDAAAKALETAARPVIHVFLGISDIHLQHKMGITRAKAVRLIEDAVAQAHRHVGAVEFSCEDATRADPIFLRQCISAALCAGATRINIPDTVGCAMPEEYGALIAGVRAFVPESVIVAAHCHDDLGLATANTVAAVRHGAMQVEVTVNGIGERAGNAALEEVAAIIEWKDLASTGLKLERVRGLSKLVAEVTGVPVQPNRAIVGKNAFAHSSGIHQDGLLKHVRTYECFPPEMVGVRGHEFVLTARSGRKAVAHAARRHGHELSPKQLESVYSAFIQAADAQPAGMSPETFREIIARALEPGTASAIH